MVMLAFEGGEGRKKIENFRTENGDFNAAVRYENRMVCE
jgi:hypothetical protein